MHHTIRTSCPQHTSGIRITDEATVQENFGLKADKLFAFVPADQGHPCLYSWRGLLNRAKPCSLCGRAWATMDV
jgi:hypothetical protein